ncbi:MAG: hypothetical protein OFPI_27400 [Osedax symbiont Rs2]|nr:MAG: hypothetical protein OFPI_27400 [Osedax symbiont Rs2]
MDVFLLGAGRPSFGEKPAALKKIASNTKAMDWQIHSFENVAGIDDIHYLGGYHIDEVVKSYPSLNYTIITDWEKSSVLHTLLKAPFSGRSVICAYSDTVFRKHIVDDMSSVVADVVFCVDSLWKDRYYERSEDDIQMAEKIDILNQDGVVSSVEFTGLVCFNGSVASQLSDFRESDVGSNLLDLISYLKDLGFSVQPFDVAGHWAEFNSPKDIAHFILGTKAETLSRLEPLVQESHIGRQVSFTSSRWRKDPDSILNEISNCFKDTNLIIRSSSKGEDNWHSSNAGGFESILNIDGCDSNAVSQAINSVVSSYGTKQHSGDQVLVQKCLTNVRTSGVVFTCSIESGAPFYRFNFDDVSKSTESVTAGTHDGLRTVILSRSETGTLELVEPTLIPVLRAIEELEQLLGYDKLDVEFAIDEDGMVHIFQVRPVTVDHSAYEVEIEALELARGNSVNRFRAQQVPPPQIHGQRTIFANMPDWNPAEIIGTRPKPLAFSLYRYLITNEVWAQQRAEYGYRDLRPCPLMVSFSGQPYIDSRASFNSFIPANLSEEDAENLVCAYHHILSTTPQYHDKIEFEVAFTIWTPDFELKSKERLIPIGVTSKTIDQLGSALKAITRNSLSRLRADISSIETLKKRRLSIDKSKLPKSDKIYALLDDCRRFGTLAFSHAARAGFVATTLLKSFVSTGVLNDERRLAFLKSFDTVAGDFEKDKFACYSGKITLAKLVEKYGHLRPGTYELSAQAYWEDPQRYLLSGVDKQPETLSDFEFSKIELKAFDNFLIELGSKLTPADLIEFLKNAIKARESVKFEFTRNLSKSLDLCVELGIEHDISRDDLSYLEFYDLEYLKLNVTGWQELRQRIETRKQTYAITCSVELPSLISEETDFFCFERFASEPNFITNSRVEAEIRCLENHESSDLTGKIVTIQQADPGFDWLFGHGIGGLITQFGGANSHMAIRSAEIGLPAAIGVGEKLYEKIAKMRIVELDCANKIIRELQ